MLTRSPKKLLHSWRRRRELRSLLAALLSWPSVVGTLHGRCCVLSQVKMCRGTPSTLAWDLVDAFLAAKFSQAERHLRRLGKVAALETKTTSPVGGEAAAISTWASCGN